MLEDPMVDLSAVSEAAVALILLTWRSEMVEATARAAAALLDLGIEPARYLRRSPVPGLRSRRRARPQGD